MPSSIVVESITPAKAKEMLASMVTNRQMSQARVIEYAIAIDEGKWSLNGETIKIDKDGRLFDGQNRLNACVLADKSFRTYVVRGIDDPDAFATVDVGKIRTATDIFGIAGFADSACASGAATVIYAFKNCKIGWSGPLDRRARLKKSALGAKLLRDKAGVGAGAWFSRQDLIEFAEVNKEELGSAVRFARSAKARKLLGPGILGGLFFLFREKNSLEAHAFFEQLGEGAGLGATDPVLHLRNRLAEHKSQRGRGVVKMSRWYWIGLTVKAWNKRRTGQSVKNLFVTQDEAFPARID